METDSIRCCGCSCTHGPLSPRTICYQPDCLQCTIHFWIFIFIIQAKISMSNFMILFRSSNTIFWNMFRLKIFIMRNVFQKCLLKWATTRIFRASDNIAPRLPRFHDYDIWRPGQHGSTAGRLHANLRTYKKRSVRFARRQHFCLDSRQSVDV